MPKITNRFAWFELCCRPRLEGDLLIAAEFVTPETVNFMARYGRGLICLTLTEQKCSSLNLQRMVADNRSSLGTNFTLPSIPSPTPYLSGDAEVV